MANSSWVVTIPGAGLPFGENRSATEKPTRYAASVSLSVGLNRHGGDSGETSWSHNACTVPAHKASFLALRPPQSSPWRISESSACRATAEPNFYEYNNNLLNNKDIFVRRAVRSNFFFLGIAVQIQNIDAVERLPQVLPHVEIGRAHV